MGGIVSRLAEHFGLDIAEMSDVLGHTVLNHRIMTNTHFIGAVQEGIVTNAPYLTLTLLM